MNPPSSGPSTGPTSAGTVSQARAETRSDFAVVRSTIRRPTGTIIEPPIPWTIRAATISGIELDRPQRIDPVTKVPRFRVIGCELWSDAPGFAEAVGATGITGICGSGIIEAIAEMRMAGLVDASGLIGSAEQTGSERSVPEGRTHAYLLHDGSAAGGPRILVTQGDVRAIQLAKSALYAGARLLMDRMGVDDVARVVLAGAFGAHISPKHAMVLGMIPDCGIGQVSSAGNAAGTGARIALLNAAARHEVEALVRRIEKVETAIEPQFQAHFVAANAMPHASDAFARLRAAVPLPDVSFNTGGARSGEGGGRRRRRG